MYVTNECKNIGLIAGIVTATDIKISESNQELKNEIKKLLEEKQKEENIDKELLTSVRKMLKNGGYKPSGRNKPASEYLLRTVSEGNFPFINNVVDINNYFSILWGLPISTLDLNKTGDNVILKIGSQDEKYIFNKSGQELDLKGLITVCDSNKKPIGTPVKDSMFGKTTENTSDIIVIIYAPSDKLDELKVEKMCMKYAEKLRKYTTASETATFTV